MLKGAAVLALGAGLPCLGLYALAELDQRIVSAAEVEAFQSYKARNGVLQQEPDQALWSASRRAAYAEARFLNARIPAALLRIPAIDLLVPIFEGTSELVLNRGIGWIESTTPPDAGGNVGLAGHRDGFFRRLGDLRVGDPVEIQTVDTSVRYRVTTISIVAPTDVYVLEPTDEPAVTLVTCYPFYFVGNAPQRFIVRGVLDESSVPGSARQSTTGEKDDEHL